MKKYISKESKMTIENIAKFQIVLIKFKNILVIVLIFK